MASERELAELSDAIDATFRQLDEGLAAGRWLARGAEGTGYPITPEIQAEAVRALLRTQAALSALMPHAIAVMVEYACIDPGDDASLVEARAESRARLLGAGLATPGELATFPEASVQAIAQERFQRWKETGGTGIAGG